MALFHICPKLSREFTKYKLKHVARFESVYSIRLYELLVQWSSSGEREIEVEWIKNQFQVGKKYSRLMDLKKRVIDPAVEEVNRQAKPGETKAAVIARLTGTSIADFAKSGETFDQAMARKKILQEVKRNLR